MAERTPPSYVQAGSYSAQSDRWVLSSWLGSEGVVGVNDLTVSQRGAGANMSVDIAAGAAYVDSDLSNHHYYGCYSDGTKNVSIGSVATSGQSRKDLVVARVRDSAHGDGSDSWTLEVVAGTSAPTGTETEPALPARSLHLATVSVAFGDTSVTNAKIADKRLNALNLTTTIWNWEAAPGGALNIPNEDYDAITKTVSVPIACRLKLTGLLYVGWAGSGDQSCQLFLRVDGTNIGLVAPNVRAPTFANASTFQVPITATAITDLTAGSHTFVLRAHRGSGSPAVSIIYAQMTAELGRKPMGRN